MGTWRSLMRPARPLSAILVLGLLAGPPASAERSSPGAPDPLRHSHPLLGASAAPKVPIAWNR